MLKVTERMHHCPREYDTSIEPMTFMVDDRRVSREKLLHNRSNAAFALNQVAEQCPGHTGRIDGHFISFSHVQWSIILF